MSRRARVLLGLAVAATLIYLTVAFVSAAWIWIITPPRTVVVEEHGSHISTLYATETQSLGSAHTVKYRAGHLSRSPDEASEVVSVKAGRPLLSVRDEAPSPETPGTGQQAWAPNSQSTATQTITPAATSTASATASPSSTATNTATAVATITDPATVSATGTVVTTPTFTATHRIYLPRVDTDQIPPVFEDTLAVVFLDVGQGDATLIVAPEGNILIDGGPNRRTVPTALADRGIDTLRAVVATHPHSDHIRGLVNVISAMTVTEFVHPGVSSSSNVYGDLATAVATRAVPTRIARAGQFLDWGDSVEAAVIHPGPTLLPDSNDASVTVMFTFGCLELLFTGDIESRAEAEIVERTTATPGALAAEVLKVAHHGSSTSSTDAFLDRVMPRLGVISVSATNSFGHPAPGVLARLSEREIEIRRTDEDGTITVTSSGSPNAAGNCRFEVSATSP